MTKRKSYKETLKETSATAKKFLKNISKNKITANFALSVVILSVGIALGLSLDEFELFLSISVALDVIIFLVNQENNNIQK